jgi:hypothetical protein
MVKRCENIPSKIFGCTNMILNFKIMIIYSVCRGRWCGKMFELEEEDYELFITP